MRAIHIWAALLLVSCAWVGKAQAGTAQEIGDAVVEVYLSTLRDTGSMLAERPPVEQVRNQFRKLKEESVQQLVTLGKQVAQMSPGERAVVERAVSLANVGLQYNDELKPIYADYSAAANHYLNQDREFFRELQSINILTQYAFFELLRKQEPEEAARLGI